LCVHFLQQEMNSIPQGKCCFFLSSSFLSSFSSRRIVMMMCSSLKALTCTLVHWEQISKLIYFKTIHLILNSSFSRLPQERERIILQHSSIERGQRKDEGLRGLHAMILQEILSSSILLLFH
jgi:hypothetical protein